jgi:transposase
MASKVWKSALEEEEKALFSLSCQNEEEALDRINHIIHRSPEEFGIHHSRWRLCDLRAVCQDWLFVTTDPGLWQVLKRLGIRYKQARAYLRSPDPDYVAKLQEIQQIIQCSAEDPQHIVVIYLDELTFYRQPSLAQAYERLGKAQPLAKLGHRSNLSSRIVAGIDIWQGKVLYLQRSKISLATLRLFYEQLAKTFPDAKAIYVIQDNWPVHFHPDVLAILMQQECKWPLHTPRNWPDKARKNIQALNLPIKFVFLPTYAPWTNPIEKLWRKLKQEVLHLHRYEDDWEGLKNRVACYLDNFSSGSTELLHYVGLSEPGKLYKLPAS